MEISVGCQCGKMTGTATDIAPEKGCHIICRCDDCRAYGEHLGNGVLDQNGGTEIFQMTPSQLQIQSGIENLRCLRHTSKGLIRWYAGCCNTAVGNTMATDKVPFVGVVHTFMKLTKEERLQAMGPILSDGRPNEAGLKMGLRFLRLMIGAKLKGKGHPTPFFKNGALVSDPLILNN